MSNSNRSYLHPGNWITGSLSLPASSPAAGGDVITEQHGVVSHGQDLPGMTQGSDPEWSSFAKPFTRNTWCNGREQSNTTATENLCRPIAHDRPLITPPDVIVVLYPVSENESSRRLCTQTPKVTAVDTSDKCRSHGGDL